MFLDFIFLWSNSNRTSKITQKDVSLRKNDLYQTSKGANNLHVQRGFCRFQKRISLHLFLQLRKKASENRNSWNLYPTHPAAIHQTHHPQNPLAWIMKRVSALACCSWRWNLISSLPSMFFHKKKTIHEVSSHECQV